MQPMRWPSGGNLRRKMRLRCPQEGIVTVAQGGRLGNQMWEYASVWAVARSTGLEPYVPRCLRRALDQVFTHLSIPTLTRISHCIIRWGTVVDRYSLSSFLESNESLQTSVLLPRFVVMPDLVLSDKYDIREEFKFRGPLEEASRKVLSSIAGRRRNNAPTFPSITSITFVGIHVRRTDYRNYLWRTRQMHLAGPEYFHRAMDYFRKKYENVAFVVVSDEARWCQHHLATSNGDVFVVSGTPGSSLGPGRDLAIMAACNHSIIDYGTFGVWGAILAGGETLLYNISRHSSVKVAQLLPNWHIFD
ncbi:galactoside alpha-(1,2)-fucosyltransferase 2-like [Ischnura elegans]|uniref:galactoside alpha-(1,2)-fucosyltransferase 2-like n=1 Tax=Ischnura elegans TaxID=197161 RepID=UPI001ED87FE0|nr:galactoside alpha-(1,2)-fucosyltransferase 2-like [Ischnura elegans]